MSSVLCYFAFDVILLLMYVLFFLSLRNVYPTLFKEDAVDTENEKYGGLDEKYVLTT